MLKCNSVHLRSTLSITVAYSLRISVRLDNIGYLVAEPYTVCCLLEKGAKTVTHLQAAEKLSVNASIPQAVSVSIPQTVPWSQGGPTFSAVTVPFPWQSHCRFPKAPLPLPPAWLEAEQKLPPSVTNKGHDSSYSSQGGSYLGCKRLMCWLPVMPWKAEKAPQFLSPILLQIPGNFPAKESLQENKF